MKAFILALSVVTFLSLSIVVAKPAIDLHEALLETLLTHQQQAGEEKVQEGDDEEHGAEVLMESNALQQDDDGGHNVTHQVEDKGIGVVEKGHAISLQSENNDDGDLTKVKEQVQSALINARESTGKLRSNGSTLFFTTFSDMQFVTLLGMLSATLVDMLFNISIATFTDIIIITAITMTKITEPCCVNLKIKKPFGWMSRQCHR